MSQEILVLPEEVVLNKIYFIRNHKVMIDRDLALFNCIKTKRLKEAVRRNIERFPKDFMFELSSKEFQNWRSQFASSNTDKMGLRYAPMVFSEHGVLMLSSVLNSQKAIQTNIQIMRIFSKVRAMLLDTTEIRLDVEKMKKKIENQGKNIELVFQYLVSSLLKKRLLNEKK